MSPTQGEDPDPTQGEISVTVTRSPLGTAPETVYFEVTGWDGFPDLQPAGISTADYDARHHDIVYHWDFGDADATYEAPEKGLSDWRDRNQGFGPYVAHTYRTPGQKTVRVTAYDLVHDVASFEREIIFEVADPSTTFPGTQTAYVSSARDFSNAPPGALRITDLVGHWNTIRGQNGPHRIILRGGEAHVLNGLWSFDNTADFHMVEDPVTAGLEPGEPGYRPRPILQQDPAYTNKFINFRTDSAVREAAFQGIDLRGNWDTTTETGNAQEGIAIDQEGHYLVDRCRLGGFYSCIGNNTGAVHPESVREPKQDATRITVHDTEITNWLNFGVWASGSAHYAFLGAKIAQDVNALSGGDKNNQHNVHGPIRFQPSVPCKAVVDGCDFFTRTGWFPNVPGFRTQQANIRWNQAAQRGSFLNIQRSAFEGGFPCVTWNRFNNNVPASVVNSVVIDKSVFVGSHMSYAHLNGDGGGQTIRSSLFIQPNVPRIAAIYDPVAVLDMGSPLNDDTTLDAPVKLYSNTLVNLMSEANQSGSVNSIDIPWVRENQLPRALNWDATNSIIHAPNLNTPNIDDFPLSETPLWAPRDRGYVSVDQPVLLAQYATPADTVWEAIPGGTSDALGTGDDGEYLAYRALTGKPRSAVAPSRGAQEQEQPE